MDVAIPAWVSDLSQVVVVVGALGALAIRIDHRLRAGPLAEIRGDVERLSKLNCVHHALLFDRVGISRDEVREAEHEAGVEGKP